MSHDCELDALKLELNDRAVEIISHIRGEQPNAAASNRSRKAVFWGRKASFRYDLHGPHRHKWQDWETGKGGDILQLILNEQTGGSFPDAVEWARAYVGWGDSGYTPDQEKTLERLRKQAEEAEKRRAEADAKRAADVKKAQAVWDRAAHPAGTPAAIYIQESRCIPVETWPDCIRFDAKEHAVVFGLTSDDGCVQAVQVIRITPDGRKIAEGSGRLQKQSYGPQDGAMVRFPGDNSGPLCVGEGPETAASVWAATGCETWATVGSTARLEPPDGRLVVLLRDDDQRDHPSQRALRTAHKKWSEEGKRVADAWPWQERREDKTDFNDAIKAGGCDAVRVRIARATDTQQPVISQLVVNLQQARETLGHRVTEFGDIALSWVKPETDEASETTVPPVHAISVTLGTGKTEAVLKESARILSELRKRNDKSPVVIAAPEHNLSMQIAARFRELPEAKNLVARVWRGREASLPGGKGDERMCGEWETVRKAASLHADIDKEVCSVCPLMEGCGYLAQRDQYADLWVVAHPMIFSYAPKPLRGAAALIIDESPWQAGLIGFDGHGIQVPLDWLDNGYLPLPKGNGPGGGARLQDIRRRMQLAMTELKTEGYITRNTLENIGFDSETGANAYKLEWMRKLTGVAWQEREVNKTLTPMTRMWRAVDDMMNDPSCKASGRLQLQRDKDGVWTIKVTGRREINEDWICPTLLVDASLDEALVKPYWPQLKVTAQINVGTPHMKVVQTIDRAFSKAMLEPQKPPKKEQQPAEAAKWQADEKARAKARHRVATFIDKVERLRPGKAVVIANKSIAESLPLQPKTPTMWFNAVAGHDEHRDARTIFVIGRAMPRPEDVERMAGALTGHAPIEVAKYARTDVWRQQAAKNGYVPVAGVAERHPDPIAERIRARIAEGEVLQSIGRGRGVSRTAEDPLLAIVLSDVVLPIPVDEFISSEMVTKPSLQDQMLALGGIAFEDAAAAAQAYPQLGSVSSLTKALQRNSDEGQSRWTIWYKNISYQNVQMLAQGEATVVYRRSGPSYRQSRAVVDLAKVPDPKAKLEQLFGSLAWFEIIDVQQQDLPADILQLSEQPLNRPPPGGNLPQEAPSAPPPPKAPAVSEPLVDASVLVAAKDLREYRETVKGARQRRPQDAPDPASRAVTLSPEFLQRARGGPT
jgi:putative DNA primase/helicase